MNSLFDFTLSPELIAQHPAQVRDASRLMVLRRSTGEILHRVFADLPELLSAGDLLVLNDTRVVQARLVGQRVKTGGKWEALFLRERPEGAWEMLAQTKGKPELGETFLVDPGPLRMILRGKEAGHWLMEPASSATRAELLLKHGRIPLPPYIRKGLAAEEDRSRYQTVYAQADGSIAAPTAGLHFTTDLLDRLEQSGIRRSTVTLHVGLGTFEPLRGDDPTQHIMHKEMACVPAETVNAIADCRKRGGRVVGVGTTATRALEAAAADCQLKPWDGETDLFIYPPYQFKVIDGLITNFHLPKTTLLLLVGALAGMEFLAEAYKIAVQQRYRFYSYGDAMIIL